MTRSWRLLLVLNLLSATSWASAFAADEVETRPNIILCMADDQGWGDVGYNGHPELKTPTLDEMAASGLRFDRFYAAAPVCSPTRGSVLTGRHPNRFACFSWGHPIRPQEITLAELMQKAGYRTGHFGKWHLGSVEAGEPTSPGENGFDNWVSSPNFYENSPLMSHEGKVVQLEGEGSEATMEVALNFIREATVQKQPFLAVIWFGSPHSPHEAIDRDRLIYQRAEAAQREYYGEITAMDRAMGTLRRELRELGVADNTLLWYTSDNGAQGPGSTGGLSGKKGSLWEGGIRVPTIIEWPARINEARATAIPCSSVDMLPTIVDLLRLDYDPGKRTLDGMSLAPLIDGQLAERDQPIGFWVSPVRGRPVRSSSILQELAKKQATEASDDHEPEPALSEELSTTSSLDTRPGHAAWIEGRYKLHRIPGNGDSFSYQLFNLEADPVEKDDLAENQPQRVERMRRALEQWQQSVINSLNGKDYE